MRPHDSTDNASHDQARRLRELATPGFTPPTRQDCERSFPGFAPRVIMVSEFPTLQGGFPLAWYLARAFSQASRRATALVDLTPSASRLAAQLAALGDPDCDTSLSARQPLWHDTFQGKTLAPWKFGRQSIDDQLAGQAPLGVPRVDVIAQPGGQFPTAEQLPRICEQLLRRFSGGSGNAVARPPMWSDIVLVSDAHGVPLDSACWQAADAIVLLLPPNPDFREQASAALAARLPRKSEAQRIFQLGKRPSFLQPWLPTRKSIIRALPSAAALGLRELCVTWPADSSFRINPRGRNKRLLRLVANELACQLNRISLPRQAG